MSGAGRIVLVRHGEADGAGRCYGARHDVPLTAAGVEQARAAAAALPSVGTLVCSPARRARQTAEVFGAAPRVDARWLERDFGAWEGRLWAECWAEAPPDVDVDAERYAAWTPPGGETTQAVQARVAEALEELAATDAPQPVVVITHAGPIRLALRHALGLDLRQTFAFAPNPGSATCLRRHGQSWTVERFGA